MGLRRVELPTSGLSRVRSNHLSYRPRTRPNSKGRNKIAAPDGDRNRGGGCGRRRGRPHRSRLTVFGVLVELEVVIELFVEVLLVIGEFVVVFFELVAFGVVIVVVKGVPVFELLLVLLEPPTEPDFHRRRHQGRHRSNPPLPYRGLNRAPLGYDASAIRAAARAAFFRSTAASIRFRSRMFAGVTSIS